MGRPSSRSSGRASSRCSSTSSRSWSRTRSRRCIPAVPDPRLTTYDRAALAASAPEAARRLLGARIVRTAADGIRAGRIVEVEAYAGPEDLASHARFSSTKRNAIMSGPPGHAYVYRVYGMYDCLNVVTGPAGSAGAILIRAIEPLEGVAAMRAARAAHRHGPAAPPPDQRLASGPGLVGVALGLDTSWTGTDLCDPASPLRLVRDERDAADQVPDGDVVVTPRIGIGYAGTEWSARPWRFAIRGHRSVSRG